MHERKELAIDIAEDSAAHAHPRSSDVRTQRHIVHGGRGRSVTSK
jgi:hypothetical protein